MIDLEDLERKCTAHPDAKVLLLSYMRGRVPDMDAVMDKIVEKQQNVDRLLANMKKQYRKLKKKEQRKKKQGARNAQAATKAEL